jgi:hypothetical protein
MYSEILIRDILKQSLEHNGVLQYFNRLLLGINTDGYFSPDINGYSLIFMLPPDLSGLKLDTVKMQQITKKFVFLAIDFTPPAIQVSTGNVSSAVGGIPFGTLVSRGGQCSITFFDTSELGTFSYHKVWVDYIDLVTKGVLCPKTKYLTPTSSEFGSIDYMTSAYVVRFRPVTGSLKLGDDIVYIGKATGIFPLNIPDKEVIGKRDIAELTLLPMSYACARYDQLVANIGTGNDEWIFNEFMTDCGNMYM